MQLRIIVEHFSRQIFAARLASGEPFENPFATVTYPCLIWTHASPLTPAARIQFAQQLVESACRYALCGGVEAEALHDDIDDAYIRPFMMETPGYEHPLMMTTWHEAESMMEVAEFFVRHTNFGDHRFAKLLLVHIGGSPTDHQALEQSVAHASSRAGAV